MIVTLAGHVDHGKTTLVRQLTGIDTDTLQQEQERGLTIDLGFAYTDQGRLGFVDVPGHHRFIHNMVAGVAEHQHALMVIAADDGPMPQSREHLEILRLLGLERGCLALTKTDRVNSERVSACEAQIRALVRGSFLAEAPIFQTSSEVPASIQPLREYLLQQAQAHQTPCEDKPFRLAIDRAFTVRGAGLVVTGTVYSGRVTLDQGLLHLPTGKRARVRGIRTQDQETQTARTGDRCALNLGGLDLDEVRRGHWLSETHAPAFRTVSLSLTQSRDFPRRIKHWMPVHVYHGTAHTTARLSLLEDDHQTPDGPRPVDLVCDTPLHCHRGDRLVLRDQGLDLTLGGGAVIYADTPALRRRRTPERLSTIRANVSTGPEAALAALLEAGPTDTEAFQQLWNLSSETFTALTDGHDLRWLDKHAVTETWWRAQERWARDQVEAQTTRENKGVRENVLRDIPQAFRQPLLNSLVQQGILAHRGGLYRPADTELTLPPSLAGLWQQIEPALQQKQAPSSGYLAKQLNQPQTALDKQLGELVKHGLLIKVASHRFYTPTTLAGVAQDVTQLIEEHGALSVRAFRDATGIGRNIAIEVLEYFDSRGFTQRRGNERVILRPYEATLKA